MKPIFLVSAISALIAGAPLANAAIYDVTLSGTIASGSDPDNIFQTGDIDLSGDLFQEKLSIKNSKGISSAGFVGPFCYYACMHLPPYEGNLANYSGSVITGSIEIGKKRHIQTEPSEAAASLSSIII